MLIDSHSHLDMRDFNDDLEEVLQRALAGGVTRIIAVGIDVPSSLKALELARRYDFVYSTIGFHPHNADDTGTDGLDKLVRMASEEKVVAWGEIGLDFFRQYSLRKNQVEMFELQLDLALQFNLPVIIHDREAHNEVLEILKKKKNVNMRGVIHCFSGDYDTAMAFIDLGYYISIPGTVTYKKAAQVQEVASRVPVDRMLVETDAPFLAPVPKRGKRNEPFFVTHTARKIAELRGVDFEEIAQRTSENAMTLFGLS